MRRHLEANLNISVSFPRTAGEHVVRHGSRDRGKGDTIVREFWVNIVLIGFIYVTCTYWE